MTAKLHPNTTQIPHYLIREVMPLLSDTEFRVLLVIADQTYGWHKDTDRISYTQLVERTGRYKEAIAKAIRFLREKGHIQVFDGEGNLIKTKEEAKGKSLFYRINKSGSEIEPLDEKEFDNRTSEIEPTKETNTKELFTNVNNGQRPSQEFGKPEINRILKEFSEVTGLDRPSDKNPRWAIQAFLRAKDRSVEDFAPALKHLFTDKGYNLTSISSVTRHFSEYKRDVKKRREQDRPEEFRGFV